MPGSDSFHAIDGLFSKLSLKHQLRYQLRRRLWLQHGL